MKVWNSPPPNSRLMFRHFRQYLIISCYFHPITFMSVYFPPIPIHFRPFVVIFRLFQAFPGNYSLNQAFPGYSWLFPAIPGHFNLYQSIQSIQPNSFFLHWLWLCVSEAVHEKGCFPLESQAIWELTVQPTRSATALLVSSTAVTKEDPGSMLMRFVELPVLEIMSWMALGSDPVVIFSSDETSSLEVK